MKTIFTTFFLLLLGGTAAEAQCSLGTPTYTTVTVDGSIADWSAVLLNNDNITYDGTPDRDAPITDMGRDFVRMAYTMDATNMYFYLQRAGSAINQVTVMIFMDVNNDGGMKAGEPIIEVVWSGQNRRGNVRIFDYVPASGVGDALTSDGIEMPGRPVGAERTTIINNGTIGTVDGFGVEFHVPLNQIYKAGSTHAADHLAFGDNFNFHVSSLNGNIASFGSPNATNDNWRKCDVVFSPLPIRMQPVITADKKEAARSITVLNNPLLTDLQFNYEAPVSGEAMIQVFTTTGHLVYQAKKNFIKGKNTVSVPQHHTAAKTGYLVSITDKNNVKTTAKAIRL